MIALALHCSNHAFLDIKKAMRFFIACLLSTVLLHWYSFVFAEGEESASYSLHERCQDVLAEAGRKLGLRHAPRKYLFVFGNTTVQVNDNTKNFRKYGYSLSDIAAAAEAAAMVWQRHFALVPGNLKISLIDSIVDKAGKETKIAGKYFDGLIYLVIPRISMLLHGLPMSARFALISAHEATHQVQEIAGRGGEKCSSNDPNYPDTPVEHEAWEVSLDVVAAFCSEVRVSQFLGAREYISPERSSFHRLTLVE